LATRGLPAWPWTRETADDVPEPERLLLEACRLWAAALRDGRSAWLAIRPPFLAEDAAEAIAEAAPSALGLDFAVDDTKPWPNHTILLGAGVLLIENLTRLSELPSSGFEVTAFPLRLVGQNGGPTRVVAEPGG
jgi:kynurenine formamidase